jgi:hypothetical protein
MATAKKRWTDEEVAELLKPRDPDPLPVVEPPPPRRVPGPALPESGAATLERLRARGAVREEGQPDPPARVVLPKRLTITQIDGRVETIIIDPWLGGYLAVERQEPVPNEPWRTEQVVGRYGLLSIASIELVDIEPVGEAA